MEIMAAKATRLPQYFEHPWYKTGWKDAKGILLEEHTDLTVTELNHSRQFSIFSIMKLQIE